MPSHKSPRKRAPQVSKASAKWSRTKKFVSVFVAFLGAVGTVLGIAQYFESKRAATAAAERARLMRNPDADWALQHLHLAFTEFRDATLDARRAVADYRTALLAGKPLEGDASRWAEKKQQEHQAAFAAYATAYRDLKNHQKALLDEQLPSRCKVDMDAQMTEVVRAMADGTQRSIELWRSGKVSERQLAIAIAEEDDELLRRYLNYINAAEGCYKFAQFKK